MLSLSSPSDYSWRVAVDAASAVTVVVFVAAAASASQQAPSHERSTRNSAKAIP